MIVKFIEPNDEIFTVIKEFVSKQIDETVLFSKDDISEPFLLKTDEVGERINLLIENDVLFEFRDDYTKEICSSDKIFGMRHHPLTVGKEYQVLGIECGSFRLINDEGEPTLFDPFYFEILDDSKPDFWVTEYFDGEEYSYPDEWRIEGFFEDLFDDVVEVIEIYETVLREKYSQN